jgi:hypothetical protein
MDEDEFLNNELVDDEIDISKFYEEDEEHKIREDEFEKIDEYEHAELVEGAEPVENEEEKHKKGESYISQQPEWRTFLDNPKSFESIRTGQALKGNRLLSTMIENKKLQRIQNIIDKTSRTDEEAFNIAVITCAFELNISTKISEQLIGDIAPHINKIKYKNALITLLAYMCIDKTNYDKIKINHEKIKIVLDEATRGTKYKIRLPDMYRYVFMLLDILKKQ